MLTKRQKNERYLSMFTFFFGLLVLMTLFVPSVKTGNNTFMGLDIVFGNAIYGTNEPIIILFSWFNFFVYFLPIIGGISLVLFDRLLYHESKIKLILSVFPMIMFVASFVMLLFVPDFVVIKIGVTTLLQDDIGYYVGPFFAVGFIIAGIGTSLFYFIQEIKIHQSI